MEISSSFTPYFVKTQLKVKEEEGQKEQEKTNSSSENLAQENKD